MTGAVRTPIAVSKSAFGKNNADGMRSGGMRSCAGGKQSGGTRSSSTVAGITVVETMTDAGMITVTTIRTGVRTVMIIDATPTRIVMKTDVTAMRTVGTTVATGMITVEATVNGSIHDVIHRRTHQIASCVPQGAPPKLSDRRGNAIVANGFSGKWRNKLVDTPTSSP